MGRARLIVLAVLAAISVACGWLAYQAPVRAQAETTILGDLISRALSTPTTRVSIGAVEGALSSDATIRNIAISDRDGVWLRLDRARLIWRRAALFSRRLEVDRLELGRLEFLRRPLPGEEAAPVSNEPILPELPLKVEVKAFSLGEIALGEPVLGMRGAAFGDRLGAAWQPVGGARPEARRTAPRRARPAFGRPRLRAAGRTARRGGRRRRTGRRHRGAPCRDTRPSAGQAQHGGEGRARRLARQPRFRGRA